MVQPHGSSVHCGKPCQAFFHDYVVEASAYTEGVLSGF